MGQPTYARKLAWRRKNSAKARAWTRDHMFKRRCEEFGITPEIYEQMREAQNNVCAICGKPETQKSRRGKLLRLAIDHDHDTGQVRGLLCSQCNNGLGRFTDDPTLLRQAAAYLEQHGRPAGSYESAA